MLFLPRCCPPLYLHEKESKKKSKSTTVILFHINKIKYHIGPSEYWFDTLKTGVNSG